MPFRSQRFDPDLHNAAAFTGGERSLDVWLREQAVAATDRRTARTWVWVSDAAAVAGYYALTAHKIARDDVPARIGRGGPAEIPAVLLARLALHLNLRGQDLGGVLLADALTRVVDATQQVAARVVVVDALTERVAEFYERHGFRRVPGSLVLVQKLTDVEAALR